MKYLLFVLVLVGTTPIFAQSKKKRNEQLKLTLQFRLKSDDSLQTIYGSEVRELEDKTRKKYLGYMTTSFPKVETRIDDLEHCIGENQKTLSRLKESFSLLEEPDLPDYKFTSGLRKGLVLDNYAYETVPHRRIPDAKLKAQNRFLEDYLYTLDSVFQLNVETVRKLSYTNKELESLCALLSKQLNQYVLRADYLQIENTKLANQLRELGQNFRIKGPGIFPSVYQEVFKAGAESVIKELPETDSPIYDLVDEVAEFPGGASAMRKFLASNFHIPEIALELGLSGKVYLKFVVQEDGSIANVRVVRGLPDCPECNKEAIRVIESMPKWKPAMINGRAVKMMYNLPITIHLD